MSMTQPPSLTRQWLIGASFISWSVLATVFQPSVSFGFILGLWSVLIGLYSLAFIWAAKVRPEDPFAAQLLVSQAKRHAVSLFKQSEQYAKAPQYADSNERLPEITEKRAS